MIAIERFVTRQCNAASLKLIVKRRTSAMVSGCIFCEIIAGRAPAEVVYQDDLTVAFVDPRQHNPGHVLVVPRAHASDIRHLDPKTGARLMETLIKMARAVDRAFPNDGMSLWHSIGPAAFKRCPICTCMCIRGSSVTDCYACTPMRLLMQIRLFVRRMRSACAMHSRSTLRAPRDNASFPPRRFHGRRRMLAFCGDGPVRTRSLRRRLHLSVSLPSPGPMTLRQDAFLATFA